MCDDPAECFLAVVLLVLGALCCSAPTAAQKRQLEEVTQQLQKAGQLFSDKKLKEAADEIKGLQRTFNKLAESTDPELVQQLEPLYSRLVKAHVKLELEGFEFPPLKKPEAASTPRLDSDIRAV